MNNMTYFKAQMQILVEEIQRANPDFMGSPKLKMNSVQMNNKTGIINCRYLSSAKVRNIVMAHITPFVREHNISMSVDAHSGKAPLIRLNYSNAI